MRLDFGLGNPNLAALSIVSAGVFGWAFCDNIFRDPNRQSKRPLLAPILVLVWSATCLILISLTQSRSGFLAFVAASGIYWGLRPSEVVRSLKKFREWWGIALVIGVFILSITGFTERIFNAFWLADGSSRNRLALWTGGLHMFYDNPFGVGSESAGLWYANWYRPLWHRGYNLTLVNTPLTLLVNKGWPFALMMFTVPFTLWLATISICWGKSTFTHKSLHYRFVPLLSRAFLALSVASAMGCFWNPLSKYILFQCLYWIPLFGLFVVCFLP